MGKKSRVKKHFKTNTKKTFSYYLRISFLSLLVGTLVFIISSHLVNSTQKCANSGSCQSDLKLNISKSTIGFFQGRRVYAPKIDLSLLNTSSSVLGTNTNEQKHIFVDLEHQVLYAFEGNKLFLKAYISSGKWGPTPVGNFHIWQKLLSTRMTGGEGSDAYDLPNVPYVMYFYQDWGLHGAYWHNNFGHPMSHGCVNMRIVDAKTLYNWVDGPTNGNLGTPVSICTTINKDHTCIEQGAIN